MDSTKLPKIKLQKEAKIIRVEAHLKVIHIPLTEDNYCLIFLCVLCSNNLLEMSFHWSMIKVMQISILCFVKIFKCQKVNFLLISRKHYC